MGADTMARSLYLRAGTEFTISTAKAVASQLTRWASIHDLHTLITQGRAGSYTVTLRGWS